MSTTVKLGAALIACLSAGGLAVTAAPGASAQPDNVVFEATGSGRAYTVDTDPSTQRYYDVQLPWQKSTTLDSGVQMLQVVVVGKGSATPGCRITLNGAVVAEKAPGGDAHCIWTR